MERQFKLSGMIKPGCLLHSTKEEAPDGALIPPTYVSTSWGSVPQYAPEVSDTNNGYDPAGDCKGYFMSCNYQPNNNCYAYACNIASNSFPQPGRYSGTNFKDGLTAEVVMNNAVGDGLVYVGTTMAELKAFTKPSSGHFVALMFSPPETEIGGDPSANWSGDYHWARCDDSVNYNSWSQKDGSDQVTNFDFAGNLISDPSQANWRVNQGPIGTTDPDEYVVTYGFHCFMFVPDSGVNII